MTNQQALMGQGRAQTRVIGLLRETVPEGSYVLFTPCGCMFISPDPQDIKRLIDTLTNPAKGNT